MSRFRLPRRTFLRGMGGLAVALPALEVMQPAKLAQAATAPKRFLVAYGGISTGRGDPDASGNWYTADKITPATTGTGYDVTPGLAPLDDFGVRDQVSIVSGLTVPWAVNGVVPAAGRIIDFHQTSIGPQVAGTRTTGIYNVNPITGSTADQIAGEALMGDANKTLVYRVEAAPTDLRGVMSWRFDPSGNSQYNQPTISPRAAFDSLFGNFVPTDPEEAKRAAFLLKQRKSILDLVRASTEDLTAKLGKEDRIRLERHLDEIRNLEMRLDEVGPVTSACEKPIEPGEDPAVDLDLYWSNEELRAEILADLVHMAFVCDLSRSASFMFTHLKCYMLATPIIGREGDFHTQTHSGGGADLDGLTGLIAWFVKHFGRLASKLRDSTDVDGRSVLDHTAMVLTFEGGHGYDPEGDFAWSTHSTENMVALIAGGAAGGLKQGQHVSAPGAHPASVVLSALKACGIDGPLGEVSDTIPELFG